MILTEKITIDKLKEIDNHYYPDRIKFCVDIKRKVVAINEEIHNDMELELYDNGSDDKDIFGGDILLDPIKIIWESHPNIKRNQELGIGQGRLINDAEWIDKCMDVLKQWII